MPSLNLDDGFKAFFFRHENIRQHEVHAVGVEYLQCLCAILCLEHRKSKLLNTEHGHFQKLLVVVDKKDACCRWGIHQINVRFQTEEFIGNFDLSHSHINCKRLNTFLAYGL